MIRTLIVGALIALGLAFSTQAAYAGTPQEDTAKWDCRTMGNHVCGPGNPQHVRPGLYSARNNGRLIITWRQLHEWNVPY